VVNGSYFKLVCEMMITEDDLKPLAEQLDKWSLLPKNCTVTREVDYALFKDKNGVLRMTMPWEDYKKHPQVEGKGSDISKMIYCKMYCLM